jgi:hypothetical protein
MTDFETRHSALAYAVQLGGTPTVVLKAATDFYAFLTTGNEPLSPSSKPATRGEKAEKASAPAADTPASTLISETPATETAATDVSPKETGTKTTSHSEPVTRTDAMRAMTQVVKLKGEAACAKALATLDAAKFSEVREDQYADLVAALEKELA